MTPGMREIITLIATHGPAKHRKNRGVTYQIDDGRLWLLARKDVLARCLEDKLIEHAVVFHDNGSVEAVVRLTEAGRAAVQAGK